jgi:hypothetical protein
LNPETEARDAAQVARAWKELEVVRRAMKGKPLCLALNGKIEMPTKGAKEKPGNLIALPKPKADIAPPPPAEEPKLASGE